MTIILDLICKRITLHTQTNKMNSMAVKKSELLMQIKTIKNHKKTASQIFSVFLIRESSAKKQVKQIQIDTVKFNKLYKIITNWIIDILKVTRIYKYKI